MTDGNLGNDCGEFSLGRRGRVRAAARLLDGTMEDLAVRSRLPMFTVKDDFEPLPTELEMRDRVGIAEAWARGLGQFEVAIDRHFAALIEHGTTMEPVVIYWPPAISTYDLMLARRRYFRMRRQAEIRDMQARRAQRRKVIA